MDAKERHELKDNDLYDFLQNFGTFWNKHGNSVSIVILLAVASMFGYRYYQSYSASKHEVSWSDLASTTTPQSYRERAQDNPGHPAIPYLARLYGAEAYHKQAIEYEAENATADSGMMKPEESLDAAESMYKQVLESDAPVVYKANAALGLANVAETRGDFDAAKTYWEQAEKIATDAKLQAIASQAKVRLGMLGELARPIVFAKSSSPSMPAAPVDDVLVPETAPVELPGLDPLAPADPG